MKKRYFVTFVFLAPSGQFGWGNTDITSKSKIKTIDDIRSIEREIAKEQHLDKVTVFNYQKL